MKQQNLNWIRKLFFVVQSLSHVQLFATARTAARQASLSFNISRSLLKLMSIKSVMPSNHLILCYLLLLLPSIFPSIRVFSNELAFHIRWSKYWSLSFSISPSNKYSGLISFRIDWFDPLLSKGLSRVFSRVFPCGSAGKESACNVGYLGSIPGLERSPGEGKGYPLQYSGLESSMNILKSTLKKKKKESSPAPQLESINYCIIIQSAHVLIP